MGWVERTLMWRKVGGETLGDTANIKGTSMVHQVTATGGYASRREAKRD